ncbi:hypothetical protein FRC02_008540 [Tulasnella sp. 418]|nr:hypothetical protein FRC02_008540 [Tulasnella sp. 418]
MFVLEQEEYQREGIDWNFVNFGLDLQPTIDLIESREPIGVLSCLDEECIMPKATDATFTQKLHSLWSPPNPDPDTTHLGVFKYTAARFEQGFIIQHYAGKVEYRTEGWLEKNKDPLNDNLTRVMAASSERYLAQLFNEYGTGQDGSGFLKKRVKKGAFRTVAQRHKEQLSSLMIQLQATQPHFVRCIVPNAFKKPGKIDVPLVLDQLRCNGVLEGIRIARLGYPNRLPFSEFRQRYEVLTPGIIPRGYMDGRKACTRIVSALELDEGVFKIGTSKVFFRAGVLAELEERRDRLLHEIFSRVQAAARRWTARRQMKKILNRAVAVRTIQRNARVYGELREWPWWQLYTKIRPMLAATRNDEELRRKEVELALVRERAERDKKEKAALEALKMQLEAAKRKVEEDLQAERDLAIDKDKIIERSKAREAELEEDIVALQADLETLDGQLDRAVEAQKATEAKYEKLKEAFDQAAEHLVRLEQEEKNWKEREAALLKETRQRDDDGLVLQAIKEELEKEVEELRTGLKEKEEDLTRVKERMDTTVADLEQKLAAEIKARDTSKSKADSLEDEVRQAKDQLNELARNASDYESMIQKKESDIVRITSELGTFRRQMEAARKANVELQAQMNTLTTELDGQKLEKDRTTRDRSKIQAELDELRSLMAAKTDEETKRNEVEKNKEAELATLRAQVDTLRKDLAEARRTAAEKQNTLQVDLDNLKVQYDAAQKSYQEAASNLKVHEERLSEVEAGYINAEKAKRMAESELQSVKSRQIDMDGQVAEATKAKEALERQLAAALTKQQDFEDAFLQLERDKASWARQMDNLRKQLETETEKRTKVEKDAKAGASELAKHKDMRVKLERELKKVQGDLQARESEVISLRSKQDKTIVEHVHVLQEAKAFTDRQLAEAQTELERQKVYIKSLEKTKARLIVDTEDLTRETEKERKELRAKEKAVRAQEEKMMRVQSDLEQERKLRESIELRARRTQDDLAVIQSQLEDAINQMQSIERAKANLEAELASLAADGDSKNANAKLRAQYEARIAELEREANEAASARATAERIKQRIDRQHAELRRLIANSNPRDDNFRERLLRELEAVDQEVEREINLRSTPRKSRGEDVRHLANVTPSKPREVNGSSHRSPPVEPPRTPDRQANNQLRQQVQVLELQMAASNRVRQHLETALRDIMFDLENSDGSKQSLQAHRSKLARENARLADLIDEEARARRTAESAQISGIQSMWDKFQKTINEERESYAKLEESRKALVSI